MAKDLRAGGYYTMMLGKWHLGSVPSGFDRWLVLPGQGVYNNPVIVDAEGKHSYRGYVTDIITDRAIEFIKERPKDKPFFLMCHHKAPHRNWVPDAKHALMYENEDVPEPPTLRDDYSTRTDAAREATMTIRKHLTRTDLKMDPPPGLSGDALLKWKYQRFIKDYLRCVASIDDNVGRLLKYLDDTGLARNTVVIYTSDQGFFLGDHGWFDKRFIYEESIRMPFLIRWPGVIKPGTVVKEMVLNVDFAPTFLAMAGLPTPSDMQGRSFAALLRGEHPADWRKSWYYRYYHDPGDHNVRAHYGSPYGNAQAGLFLEEGPVGMLRPGPRPGRVAQYLQRSIRGGRGCRVEEGALSPQKGSAGQRRVCSSPAARRHRRPAAGLWEEGETG